MLRAPSDMTWRLRKGVFAGASSQECLRRGVFTNDPGVFAWASSQGCLRRGVFAGLSSQGCLRRGVFTNYPGVFCPRRGVFAGVFSQECPRCIGVFARVPQPPSTATSKSQIASRPVRFGHTTLMQHRVINKVIKTRDIYITRSLP